MAQTCYPFDAGAGANVTENQWYKMARVWALDGVVQDSGGGPVSGELGVFADSTGLQVKVRPGQAWGAGAFYENDTQFTLGPFAAAHPTLDRIDRVVVRIDWNANTGQLTVLGGAPAASPTPPQLALAPGQLLDLPLAQVRVRAGATIIGAGDVTDERRIPILNDLCAPGIVRDFAGGTVPRGNLLCYGQAVSRVTYADLFAAIGVIHGAGDGATTFNVPDCRGRGTIGLDNLGGPAAGRVLAATDAGTTGGEATHLITVDEIPTHQHTVNLSAVSDRESATHAHAVDPPAATTGAGGADHSHGIGAQTVTTDGESAGHSHGTTGTGGGSHSHGAGTYGGTTGGGTPHQHSFPANLNASLGTARVATNQDNAAPGTVTTDAESAHTHTFAVGGTSGATNIDHSHAVGGNTSGHTHSLTIGAHATDTGGASHSHTLDIASFTSGTQTDNHQHSVTISGLTGGTGTGLAHNNMPPWWGALKIIKF